MSVSPEDLNNDQLDRAIQAVPRIKPNSTSVENSTGGKPEGPNTTTAGNEDDTQIKPTSTAGGQGGIKAATAAGDDENPTGNKLENGAQIGDKPPSATEEYGLTTLKASPTPATTAAGTDIKEAFNASASKDMEHALKDVGISSEANIANNTPDLGIEHTKDQTMAMSQF